MLLGGTRNTALGLEELIGFVVCLRYFSFEHLDTAMQYCWMVLLATFAFALIPTWERSVTTLRTTKAKTLFHYEGLNFTHKLRYEYLAFIKGVLSTTITAVGINTLEIMLRYFSSFCSKCTCIKGFLTLVTFAHPIENLSMIVGRSLAIFDAFTINALKPSSIFFRRRNNSSPSKD